MALPGQSRGSRRRKVTGKMSEENWHQAQQEQSWKTPGTLSGRYSEIVHSAKFEETEEDTAAIECKVDITNARNFSKWSKTSTLEARRRNVQMLNSEKMAILEMSWGNEKCCRTIGREQLDSHIHVLLFRTVCQSEGLLVHARCPRLIRKTQQQCARRGRPRPTEMMTP